LVIRGADQRAGLFGAEGVADAHRDARGAGRRDGARVEHLGAEVRQLEGLFEAQRRQHARRRRDPRVGGRDAVDVGPDLEQPRVERLGEQGGGVVGAAAAEAHRLPLRIAAVETRQEDKAVRRLRGAEAGEAPAHRRGLRGRLERVAGAGQDGERVEQAHRLAARREQCAEHGAACPFAERHGVRFDARRAVAQQGDAAQALLELGRERVERAHQAMEAFRAELRSELAGESRVERAVPPTLSLPEPPRAACLRPSSSRSVTPETADRTSATRSSEVGGRREIGDATQPLGRRHRGATELHHPKRGRTRPRDRHRHCGRIGGGGGARVVGDFGSGRHHSLLRSKKPRVLWEERGSVSLGCGCV
jgi:hypothetical protein